MAKVVTDVVGGIGTLLGFSAPAKAAQASTQVIQAPAPPTPAAAPTVAPHADVGSDSHQRGGGAANGDCGGRLGPGEHDPVADPRRPDQ